MSNIVWEAKCQIVFKDNLALGHKHIKLQLTILRPKKNTCVSANMAKKIRVGRSENLF